MNVEVDLGALFLATNAATLSCPHPSQLEHALFVYFILYWVSHKINK